MSKYPMICIKDVTNNLDSKRIPLNSQQRKLKESNPIYPYVGANNILGYIDEFIFDEKILCVAEDGGSWGFMEDCSFIIDEKCWVNNHAHVLTAKDNLNLEYLSYYLNFANLNPHITGSTRGKLNKGRLNKIKIPLPPLKTQKHIAAILDDAAALRDKTAQLLTEYDLLAQSIFLEMFGDPGTNNKNFEIRQLDEFYISKKEGTKCGPFGGALKKEEYVEEGIAVWNMDNISKKGELNTDIKLRITEEKFSKLESYNVVNNDIIISRAGTVGKMCVINSTYEKSIISTNLIRLRLNSNKLLPLFFSSMMNYFKERVGRLKTGAEGSFTHMNTGVLNNLKFPYPPIELQNQFAEKIALIEQQKALAKQELQESEDLFNCLLQKAFKGEL